MGKISRLSTYEEVCPHCRKAIVEEDVFYDREMGHTYHASCLNKGPINRRSLNKNIPSMRTSSTKSAYRYPRMVRLIPHPGQELKEAILVGDEVEIFLRQNALKGGTPEPDIKGVVERRNKDTIWVRDPENTQTEKMSVSWNDRGNWAFIRVYRGKNGVVYYVNGNPYDEDSKTVSQATGLGLILEPEPPPRWESVSRTLRGETPDMEFTSGQVPKTMEVVAPSAYNNPVLKNVREILRDFGVEPEMVDDVGHGRVMILTQDGDLKRAVTRILQRDGMEVKNTRSGALLVSPLPRKLYTRTALTPTQIPIPIQPTPNTPAQGFQGIAPQLVVDLPKQQSQIQTLQKQTGAKPQYTPKGTEFVFQNPEQLRRFLTKSKTYTSSRKRQTLKVAAMARMAIAKENYPQALACLYRLGDLGIRSSTIAKSLYPNREAWRQFAIYLENMGEEKMARIAKVASNIGRARL